MWGTCRRGVKHVLCHAHVYRVCVMCSLGRSKHRMTVWNGNCGKCAHLVGLIHLSAVLRAWPLLRSMLCLGSAVCVLGVCVMCCCFSSVLLQDVVS